MIVGHVSCLEHGLHDLHVVWPGVRLRGRTLAHYGWVTHSVYVSLSTPVLSAIQVVNYAHHKTLYA